jgi:molecular chaperone DnaK
MLCIPADKANTIILKIFQGENEVANQNLYIGKLKIENVSPSSENEPNIEVTMDMDSDGVLNVSVKDMMTGKTLGTLGDIPPNA